MKNIKIVEYHLCSCSDLSNMKHELRCFIDNGWQPFGSGYYNEKQSLYIQPVVKYEKRDLNEHNRT